MTMSPDPANGNGRATAGLAPWFDVSGTVKAPQQNYIEVGLSPPVAGEDLTQFLQALLHEVRQELTILCADAEHALRHAHSAEDLRQVLLLQVEHVKAMDETVTGMISSAKHGLEKLRPKRQRQNLSAVVMGAVDAMFTLAAEHDVKLSANVPESLLAEVDASLIHRLVVNLIDNAVKYNRSKGSVRVVLSRSENEAYILIRDTGIGIARDDLPHIFIRSYRSSWARNSDVPGEGLGLFLAKSIVDAHGGRIQASSEEGSGTTLRVWLPLSA